MKSQKKFVEQKLKEIEDVNLDFAGQTVKEKLDEGVVYFNNPLRDEDEDDINNMKALNIMLENAKNEHTKLYKKKKIMLNKNKQKLEQIRDIREKMETLI